MKVGDFMFKFKHIGKEIKGWAKALAIVIFIPFVIAGVVTLVPALMSLADGEMDQMFTVIVAVLFVGLGYLIARLSAIILFGYGELIDKVTNISSRVDSIEAKIAAPVAAAVQPQPEQEANIVVDNTGDGTSDR